MRLAFPLSVKVSLWLLLNLVLLAAVGLAFVVTQSGFGWDALITGPAGNRLQAVANVIAAELRADPARAREDIIARFSEAYGVEFSLFQNNGRRLAGPDALPPGPVLARITEARGLGLGQRGGGPPGQFGPPGPGPRGNGPPPNNQPGGLQAPDPLRPGPPPAGPGDPGDPRAGRFLVRSTDPVGYWAGVRLPPLPAGPGGGQLGATLILHTTSLGGTALLLDFQPWLVAGAVALILSVLFWLPLVHSITRALGQLTSATEEIAEGRFDARVDESRRDELGRLGGAVNRMAGRLDQLVTGQKRFLGDIAHELGSPVGRMQLGVGILEDSAPPALQPAVADVREEVQQMSVLVGELLAFTQAGLKPRDAELALVELAPLVARVLAREAAASRVAVTVPAGLLVEADEALLARALGNLVRNALRYAGDAGPITLTASTEETEVVIAVEDCGPGVPAETLERLGEPFYRPELARTRETGGAGLGLAIVKSSLEACRGTVTFSNREPHGFRAEVRLAAE